MNKTEISENDEVTEGVIIEKPSRNHVDKAHELQEMRELASCGQQRRDAPADTEEEDQSAAVDLIIEMLMSGEKLGNDDLYGVAQHPVDAEKISRLQENENFKILGQFTKEYIAIVREALVKAMKDEEYKNTDGSFTTLAEWDFKVDCEKTDCDGKINSNKLWMKASKEDYKSAAPKEGKKDNYEKPPRCDKCGETQSKKRFEKHRPKNVDPSSPEYGEDCFNETSKHILRALLVQACKTRYQGNSKYLAVVQGKEAPIMVQTGEDGNTRELGDKISLDGGFIREEAIEVANIARLVLEANEFLPAGVDPISITDEDGNELQIKRSSGSSRGVFYARGAVVRDDIASRIRGLRENESGVREVLSDGSTKLEDWSTRMATDILFAIEKIGLFDWGPPRQANNMEEGWMVKLSQGVTDYIDNNFKPEDLSKFYNEDTLLPMICEPDDWQLLQHGSDDELIAKGLIAKGAFVTEQMQKRQHIVPRTEKIHRRLGQFSRRNMDRIDITQESLRALNEAQSTAFRVNEEILPVVRNAMIEHIRESVSDSVVLRRGRTNAGSNAPELVLELHQDRKTKSYPSTGSLSEWVKELEDAKSLFIEEPVSSGRFYHPLRMDHRGRVYTISTRLDPQGDDVSRALIQLDSPLPLTEDGWKWLSIATAKAWEGIDVPGAPDGRSPFSKLLTVSASDEFISTMRSVSVDPLGTMDMWTDSYSDLMRSHAEGFQRLAVTMAFVKALDSEGGPIDSLCRHIVVQDASSNIYQHNSMLILDQDMAMKVNVMESESGKGPNDVYTIIAETVREDKDKKFLDKLMGIGFDQKRAREIIDEVSVRRLAKSPVMVTGYGAGKNAIVEKYLTHNGKSKKEGGRLGWFRIKEDEDYFKDFENALKEASKSIDDLVNHLPGIIENIPENRRFGFSWKRGMASRLREVLKLPGGVSTSLNDKDRTTIVKNHPSGITPNNAVVNKSMSNAELRLILKQSGLPTSGNKDDMIERLSLDRHKEIENLFSMLDTPPITKCAHSESQLASILGMKDATLHEPVARAITQAYLNAMREVLPNYDRVMREMKKLQSRASSWELEWTPGADGLTVHHKALRKPVSTPIQRKKGQAKVGESPGSLSRKKYRSIRDPDAEARAISPNFVHSIDAAHMRKVAADLCNHQIDQEQPPQFWMVHDAFGTHPNHVGVMREIVRKNLGEIYQEIIFDQKDLVREAYKVSGLTKHLGSHCIELFDASEQVLEELYVDDGEWVFIEKKPFRERIEAVLELMELSLESHPALTHEESSKLSLPELKEMCKDRFTGYHLMNMSELQELLSSPLNIIKAIPGSPLDSLSEESCHNLPNYKPSRSNKDPTGTVQTWIPGGLLVKLDNSKNVPKKDRGTLVIVRQNIFGTPDDLKMAKDSLSPSEKIGLRKIPDETCLHCHTLDFISSIEALYNLGTMLDEKDEIIFENIFENLYAERNGQRFFKEKTTTGSARRAAMTGNRTGIGSLDLNAVTSVGDMDNWYFLS